MEIVWLSTAGRKQLSCPAGAEVKNTVSPTLWPERQSTAAALPSFYEGSRWPSWPCTDGEAVHIVLYACVSKIGGQPRFKSNHFSRLHASFVTYMLIYLSIPFSLCLCFLDISKPPPQAPCTGRNTFTTVRTIISDELDSWCWYFPALKVALRPREATCCTFHRCLQFHWWDQRPHRRWCRRWRSRTLEHSPANQKHHKDICWNSMSYVQVVMFILSCDCRHQRDGLKHVFVVFVDRSNNPIETAALVLYKLTSTTLLCRVCLIVPCLWPKQWASERKHCVSGLLRTFTFCLASITLASKSAGMTLPLEKEAKYIQYQYIWSFTFLNQYVGPACETNLLSVFKRIRFSVPKPRAALAFLME